MMLCIYDIYAGCTSIVARDPEGKIVLGRDLDFSFTEYLRKTHLIYNYTRNGKEVYRCSGFAGLLGDVTCMKNN